ncbi:MAG: hypothetical protein GXP43_01935 [bacterium]|nr:hypothetical protein [bacterium]
MINFDGVVADKHSIGGVAGTRVTLILVPLLASLGIKMLATPSRAITTPSGTADDMEILAKVSFSIEKVKKLIERVGACIVWGGSLNMAPADDKLIQVEKVLFDETLDKILVSIMAKKAASGATHVVIEIPIGPDMKIHNRKLAEKLGRDFVWLGKKFGLKVKPVILPTYQPAGAVGPYLETQEALRVLQQKANRNVDLENRSLLLAYHVLDLVIKEKEVQQGLDAKMPGWQDMGKVLILEKALKEGWAWQKMSQIIKNQGGQPIDSEKLTPTSRSYLIKAKTKGVVSRVYMKHINRLSRLLGAPDDKQAGMILYKKLGESVKKGDNLYKFWAFDKMKLNQAVNSLSILPIYKII